MATLSLCLSLSRSLCHPLFLSSYFCPSLCFFVSLFCVSLFIVPSGLDPQTQGAKKLRTAYWLFLPP